MTDSWRARAACRGMDIEMFFPTRGGVARAAKEICIECPVRTDCLVAALTEEQTIEYESRGPFGIRGGITAQGRKDLRAEVDRRAAS